MNNNFHTSVELSRVTEANLKELVKLGVYTNQIGAIRGTIEKGVESDFKQYGIQPPKYDFGLEDGEDDKE